jgi:23S rRNA (cytidine1920-2'-O)/16S rRNA (cytidine1409-2'-O)-methyltransferase
MKKKISEVLVEKEFIENIDKAKNLINCGFVFIKDKKITKDKILNLNEIDNLRIKHYRKYVSRGALKLESVFDNFHLNLKDLICLDLGASTGGFTDYLIQHGVFLVYAIDVGRGLLDQKLLNSKKVISLENINIKNIESYNLDIKKKSVDLVVADLSFISLKKIIKPILGYLKNNSYLITLVKPQFEAPKGSLEKGGVLKNKQILNNVLEDIKKHLESLDLKVLKCIPSKLKGPKGNVEYFYISKKI